MRCHRFVRSVTLLIISLLLIDSPALAAKAIDPGVMRAKIAAHGEGQAVRVTLDDKTQVKGFIVSINDQNFVLKETGRPGQPRTIDYTQVRGVQKGHRSTLAKVGIVTGITVGVLACAALVAYATSDYDW